jgi:hypothetical protein
MENRSLDEVAESIAGLYSRSFGEKSYGNYLLSPEDFRKLAGRERIGKSVFDQVAEILRTEHRILLVQANDCYAVLAEPLVLRLRRVPAKLIRGSAGAPRTPSPKTTLKAAAAWPFPASRRP